MTTAAKIPNTNAVTTLLNSTALFEKAFTVLGLHASTIYCREEFEDASKRVIERLTEERTSGMAFDNTDRKLQAMLEEHRKYGEAVRDFLREVQATNARYGALMTLCPDAPKECGDIATWHIYAVGFGHGPVYSAILCGPAEWANVVQKAIEAIQPNKYACTKL